MIDWNELPFFLAVAQQGSLSGAAMQLGVNHSTVFRRINALEDKLGVRLFERLADGYMLTEMGHEVLQHANQAQHSIHALERAVAGKDHALSGVVRITAPVSITDEILVPAIATMHLKYPGIKVQLVVSNLLHDLSRRDADIAIRATKKPPEHLIGRKVADFVWAVYASPEYLKQHSTPNDLSGLAQHQLIGPDETLLSIACYQWFNQHFSDEQIICRASDINTIANLCQQNLGIAFLPSNYFNPKLVRLFKAKPEFVDELWILTHPDLRQVTRIRLVNNFLYEYIDKLNL